MDPIVGDQKPIQAALKEIQKLLDRFASGGNQSERYAHEVAERIALLFPEDTYLRSVGAILDAYKTRVGKAEAEQACRQTIKATDFRLYGERFAWSGVPEEHRRAWEAVFAIDRGSLRADLPDPCPICGRQTLHLYYRVYRGGHEDVLTTDTVEVGLGAVAVCPMSTVRLLCQQPGPTTRAWMRSSVLSILPSF